MNIDEARKRRNQLAYEIQEAIYRFEMDTDLKVDHIGLARHDTLGQLRGRVSVIIEVEL